MRNKGHFSRGFTELNVVCRNNTNVGDGLGFPLLPSLPAARTSAGIYPNWVGPTVHWNVGKRKMGHGLSCRVRAQSSGGWAGGIRRNAMGATAFQASINDAFNSRTTECMDGTCAAIAEMLQGIDKGKLLTFEARTEAFRLRGEQVLTWGVRDWLTRESDEKPCSCSTWWGVNATKIANSIYQRCSGSGYHLCHGRFIQQQFNNKRAKTPKIRP